MTIIELSQLVKKDLGRINKDELIFESARIPEMFNKYHELYTQCRLLKLDYEKKFNILEKVKWEYYSGKADPEVYKAKPFNLKLHTQEGIKRYMETDEELTNLKERMKILQEKEDFLKRVLSSIDQRQWNIRNINESMKFFHGNN